MGDVKNAFAAEVYAKRKMRQNVTYLDEKSAGDKKKKKVRFIRKINNLANEPRFMQTYRNRGQSMA